MKLFIGSLPYAVTENELSELFSGYGQVISIRLIRDHFTGRPKGYAFVEMSTRAEGHRAMEDLNGKEYKFRKLICNEAKQPRKRRGRRW